MELIDISNAYKPIKYLISSNFNENQTFVTKEKKETFKLIIIDLNSFINNPININFEIESLYFVSSSLIQNLELEKINKILSKFPYFIPKIKFYGNLTNNDLTQIKQKINLFSNVKYLSIKNSIYPNFNLFDSFNNNIIETFKLDNFKFSSNKEINDFFDFIEQNKIKNLILNNIFVEILENNDEDINNSKEYGVINTYFEFNGNEITLNKNGLSKFYNINSLVLNNCKLLYLNLEEFYLEKDTNIKVISSNNSILNEEDSIFFFLMKIMKFQYQLMEKILLMKKYILY